MLKRTPLGLVALLLLLPMQTALFLVGEGNAGGEISILCENQERVFVSSPDGEVLQLDLDSAFQAEFIPQQSGPYTVQCGRETATIAVESAQQAGAGKEKEQENAFLLLAAAGIFFAAFAAAALLLAKNRFSKNVFSKTVEGNRAQLHLRAEKKLEKIEIEDPVQFSYPGKPLRFSVPRLEAGKEWSWEYDIATPEKALPATLEAWEGKRKISMLSKLLIEGKGGIAPKIGRGISGSPPTKIKRKLQKAA